MIHVMVCRSPMCVPRPFHFSLLFALLLFSLPSVASAQGAAASPSSQGPSAKASAMFFIDGGIRYDAGTFLQRTTVGRNDQEDNNSIKAFGPLLHLGAMGGISKHVRLGGAFGYGGNYNISQKLTKEERQNDREPQRWEMGQLITADFRMEWSHVVSGPFSVLVTPMAGITAIIPGGDLMIATDEVADSHRTSQGPRLGFLLGADMGARYHLNSWFSIKTALGYSYTWQSLLKATANGETADSKRVWKVSASRLSAVVGLEASF
jgi:hypothetical protein